MHACQMFLVYSPVVLVISDAVLKYDKKRNIIETRLDKRGLSNLVLNF